MLAVARILFNAILMPLYFVKVIFVYFMKCSAYSVLQQLMLLDIFSFGCVPHHAPSFECAEVWPFCLGYEELRIWL